MIYLPSTLTPVPRYPGYFWDVKSHKMFSLKMGGELREMKERRVHPILLQRGYWRGRLKVGDRYYQLSRNGRRRIMLVRDLKKLELVDYDIPVVMRKVEELA